MKTWLLIDVLTHLGIAYALLWYVFDSPFKAALALGAICWVKNLDGGKQ